MKGRYRRSVMRRYERIEDGDDSPILAVRIPKNDQK